MIILTVFCLYTTQDLFGEEELSIVYGVFHMGIGLGALIIPGITGQLASNDYNLPSPPKPSLFPNQGPVPQYFHNWLRIRMYTVFRSKWQIVYPSSKPAGAISLCKNSDFSTRCFWGQ